MHVATGAGARLVELGHGPIGVRVGLSPLAIEVARAEAPLINAIGLELIDGEGHDQLITLTEGVLVDESVGEPVPLVEAQPIEVGPRSAEMVVRAEDGRTCALALSLDSGLLTLSLRPHDQVFRLAARITPATALRASGLGARHGEAFEQTGRRVQLGADRRYTGPDCPPEMAEIGGIPQGDYAPVPWVLTSAGFGVHVRTDGAGCVIEPGAAEIRVSCRSAAGPLTLELPLEPTPAAQLRRFCALTGFPALLPEWAYGHWKSRDFYESDADVIEDFEGYREHSLPLDAIVIDSPWETQYNTWEFNPHQFPDAEGLIRRMRSAGVRTVVWVTPWVNLESADGQYPPDLESERMHREPAPNYAPAAAAGHFIRAPEDDGPYVGNWWMGTGSPVDFTSHAAREWWKELAARVLELGVEGIKADDGEGYYLPPGVRFADGRCGAEAAWDYGRIYRETMQEVLDEVHPGEGVLFGRSGWSGQQATGILWGGDQASDFWSLRALLAATLTAAASGFSNWSHDVGGYLGHRLVDRCPPELLVRWAQLGCFTPLMQAHGRMAQEAWRYDPRTLSIYRDYVLLHERLVPYVRAAAATAARCALPIIRPLCLIDPDDKRGWEISDCFGYGPSLWVAPVVEEGARRRRVPMPAGDWVDFWSGERVGGGGEVIAPGPRERIPVWVRAGAILVTYPADHVARGLGDTAEGERALEATLYGEPACGRALARLADGTRVSWVRGDWSVRRADGSARDGVTFAVR